MNERSSLPAHSFSREQRAKIHRSAIFFPNRFHTHNNQREEEPNSVLLPSKPFSHRVSLIIVGAQGSLSVNDGLFGG